MEPYFIYVIGGVFMTIWVMIETWVEYRKLDYFEPNKREVILNGITHAILYSTFWPTVLILFGLGKMMPWKRHTS